MSKCAGCGAVIEWEVTASGRSTPVNADGTPHWATCPFAERFRRRNRSGSRPTRVESCSWCQDLNPMSEKFCGTCGHEAHTPRMFCRCPKCRPGFIQVERV